MRRRVPLFDRYGVDLVINGHNHCYERTQPLRAGAPVAEVRSGGTWGSAGGVTYLCAGGGGGQTFPMSTAPLSTITVEGGARIPERAPWSAFRYNDHSLLLIHVDPPGAGGTTSLTVRAVGVTGAEFDRVTLLRRRERALPAQQPAAQRRSSSACSRRPGGRAQLVVELQGGLPLGLVVAEPAQFLPDGRLVGGRDGRRAVDAGGSRKSR